MLFLFLEIIAAWFIIKNNTYQGAKFFNSSNSLTAGVLESSDNISDYFDLAEVNNDLAEENAMLMQELQQLKQNFDRQGGARPIDSSLTKKYEFIKAEVVNNSTRRFTNYITVNRGSAQGVEPDMAVIDNQGVVGKVKAVSKNFSVINSILHADVLISSKIKRTGNLCTTQWGGIDPYKAQLKYVPLHVDLQKGDSIVTSGFNAVFPQDILIGTIDSFEAKDDDIFYEVEINLASDLNQLSYVYLIKNTLKPEKDSLENEIIRADVQ